MTLRRISILQQAKKTLEDIKSNPIETNEIIRLFLTGLRDPRVRIAVRSRLDDLDLTKIAKATRNAQQALKESSSTNVNHVAADQEPEDKISDELSVMNINANKILRVDKQNIECFKCRKIGHYARDCRTSYGGNGNKSTTKFSCYNCGKPNHYARDCRSKRTQN